MDMDSQRAVAELIEHMHFFVDVSLKIYGLYDEKNIYHAVRDAFKKSSKYTVGILVLTEDGKNLKVITSLDSKKIMRAEKETGMSCQQYLVSLHKSSVYRSVVREGKTIAISSKDIMRELLPGPLGSIATRLLGLEENYPIITPLYLYKKIIGALSVNSASLNDYFIPTVKGLANHISQALELASEHKKRQEAEANIKKMAYYDYLTGLPNRALLMDRLELALIQAERNHNMTAIISMDLNDFKKVNDSSGHLAGDQVLKDISSRIKQSLRKEDTVGRMGGDEFLIILPSPKSVKDIEKVVKKIIKVFAEPFLAEGKRFHLNASLGIAVFPIDGSDKNELLQKSDIALYKAKEIAGSGYFFYHSSKK